MLRKMRTLMAAVVLMFQAGCTWTADERNPERMLVLAISALAGQDDYSFAAQTDDAAGDKNGFRQRRVFEGYIEGHNRLYIRCLTPLAAPESGGPAAAAVFAKSGGQWKLMSKANPLSANQWERMNPLTDLERLLRVNHSAVLSEAGQADRLLVLDIRLDRDAAKTLLQERLEREIGRADPGGWTGGVRERLPSEQWKQLRKELDSAFLASRNELRNVLRTLDADVAYRLWIDRKSFLPRKFESKIRLAYQWEGRKRLETSETRVTFHSFNEKKDFAQPEWNVLQYRRK